MIYIFKIAVLGVNYEILFKKYFLEKSIAKKYIFNINF